MAALLVVMVALCVAEPEEDSIAQLGEDESMPSSIDALHAHNNALIQQIASLGGGGVSPSVSPGPSGPTAMAGMLAMGPAAGAGGGSKQEGIKEALTAVKPIMDKYVNTAKTLTGKYTALKQAYAQLKAEKAKPDLVGRAKMNAQLKKAGAKNNLKYSKLQGKYRSLERNEVAQQSETAKEETELKQNNVRLETQNQNIAGSFMEELGKAKEAAKKQITSLRTELNKFMSASNEAQIDSIGEATEKALMEKQVLQLKTPQMEETVRTALKLQAAKDETENEKKKSEEKDEKEAEEAKEEKEEENPTLSR